MCVRVCVEGEGKEEGGRSMKDGVKGAVQIGRRSQEHQNHQDGIGYCLHQYVWWRDVCVCVCVCVYERERERAKAACQFPHMSCKP